jgi:predicted outer membrane protein
MRRRIVRSTIAGLIAVIAAAFPATGFVLASQQPAQAADGPLKPIEVEFLTVIRFANLWEIPMGDLAVKRGTTQAVKDAGAVMFKDHTALNVSVKDLAAKYDVQLPDQPTSSQRSWMAEISSKTGTEFDRVFVDRVRAAHGTVFGLVAEVRAEALNEPIRAFAQSANEIVMKHMSLLEATGLAGPHSMFAEASARTTAYPENSLGKRDIILALVMGVVMIGVTLFAVRTLSSRGSAER